MTSSSYAASTSLRKTAASALFRQKQMPTTGVRLTPNALSISKLPLSSLRQSSTSSIVGRNAQKEKPPNFLPKRNNECSRHSFAYSLASSNTTWSKRKVNRRPFTILVNDRVALGNACMKDAHPYSGQFPDSDLLCSYQNHHELFNTDLKLAPTSSTSSVRNLSRKRSASSNKIPNSTMKVSYPAAKGGESSWQALFKQRNHSGGGSAGTQARSLPEDSLTRIFQAVFNYQLYRDFLIKKSYFGKKAMSLSLLLDPIVGSPPSALSSPLQEARDDISALSEGFTRKVKLFPRRLSTSFDEPSNSDSGRVVTSGVKGAKSIEHVGPFGFRSVGFSKLDNTNTCKDEESEEKKAKLNEWLEKLHQEAITKGNSRAGENIFSNSDGSRESNDNGSQSNHDDDDKNSKLAGPAVRISEDLFQLLEKVIGCKGRNISHITVEQSVKHLCTVYMDADDDDKMKFFTLLAEKYGVDHDYVITTATSLASCKDNDVRLTLEEKLRGALVPKSQWLFTQIGRLENGVKFLVDMRVDLLDAIEVSKGKSSLKALNNSLRDLIGMWFNVGFLNLERVTWQSSCDMLQKISEYEAVHPMRNWTDLKKRVGPNRRCFVFTHNSMPGEPVVVLHTFLTDHIASSVQKIVSNHRMRMMSLDSDLPITSTTEDPDSISTAIFYSITSTQRGLTGIELGNYLIKRVVRELQSEFPKMTQFSTLSPIPGFKNWLVSSIKNAMKGSTSEKPLLTDLEMNSLKLIFDKYDKQKSFYEVFLDVLKLNSWFSDEKLVKELEKPLVRLCAQYLYLVKRRGYALDPVANFHLKNGAVIWRINWLGDDSPRGLSQSCGMMVNYRYFLETCESNSQNYMENQEIQISDQVKHFIKLAGSHL